MQQLIERHDVELERIVIASLLLNPELVGTPDATFPDECFYFEGHRRLYRATCRVHRATGCTDVKLVSEQAREDGLRDAPLQLAGILADPAVLDSPTYCTAWFPAYAQRLRRLYGDREKSRAVLTYNAAIAQGQDEQEARIILDATLDAIEQLDVYGTSDDEILELLGGGSRMPTGMPPVDGVTGGGMTSPGLNVLAARPSAGKSALARSIIRHAAQRDRNVFWYSIDQSIGQVYELEIAHLLRRSTLTVREMRPEQLREAIRRVRSDVWRDRVVLIDKPLALPTLLSHARASGAQLVVIDYLQAIDSGVSESEYDAVTRVSKALKALALEMGIPVLALSQLSRAARAGEAPSLNHLRASGQIEQDADQVWGLERDTSVSSAESQEATLHILKNKTGPTGQTRLTWHGKTASYEHWAPEGRAAGYAPS